MRPLRTALLATMVSVLAAVAGGDRASAQEVLVLINKTSQRMSVVVEGELFAVWDVSTGRSGYGTPTGYFRPQWMARTYFSRKYYNSPMPHAIFFHHGFAIHGTEYIHRLGGPASHGCVRLHPRHAAVLFALVRDYGMASTRIVIGSSGELRRRYRRSMIETDRDRAIAAQASQLPLAEQGERRQANVKPEQIRSAEAIRHVRARSTEQPFVPNPDMTVVKFGVIMNAALPAAQAVTMTPPQAASAPAMAPARR